MSAVVGIIMGSDSDLSIMQAAARLFDELEVVYEIDIVSAHRTPDKLHEYAGSAERAESRSSSPALVAPRTSQGWPQPSAFYL